MNPSSNTFVGKRLTEARTARGLTMTQLAEMTGIKKQSISNYEKDKQTPKAEALSALTDSLKVSLAYFQKEIPVPSSAPIFFRSLSGLAKKEWLRAEVKLAWFEQVFSYLSSLVNFVPANIPSYDVSNRINKVTRGEIEGIAEDVRCYWNLGLGPISNVTRLLENNGAIIIRMMLDVKDEDAFSQWQGNYTTPVIVSVAEKFSACRDRFSLAHELGHLVLHRNISIKQENMKLIEEQANQFASSFLMPGASYLREFRYPTLEIFKVLKEKWKVSIKSQVFRCRELGVITDNSSKNFYMNIAKRKWIKNEPLDDIIPPEEPKVIQEALKILNNNASISIDDISRETSIGINDLAMLCGIELPDEEPKENLPSIKKTSKVIQFHSIYGNSNGYKS